ncbi:hypothetical protein ElyMa_000270100 [Elysia marginata]|uniref:Uncharacterized protein n=1 Tax=Elysia marginata TaxID=1093978 RepID=A0AAV4F468_9GAST|nr:hypothetical protein ElyMa_000270100 [Elysia marginata]
MNRCAISRDESTGRLLGSSILRRSKVHRYLCSCVYQGAESPDVRSTTDSKFGWCEVPATATPSGWHCRFPKAWTIGSKIYTQVDSYVHGGRIFGDKNTLLAVLLVPSDVEFVSLVS